MVGRLQLETRSQRRPCQSAFPGPRPVMPRAPSNLQPRSPRRHMPEISFLEIETAPRPSVAVIWMHGLGADGADFEPIVPELGLASAPAVRFVFPHAPYQPVTCNGGYVMRAWYDIVSLEPDSREIDETGLLASRALIRGLIAREVERGIPSHRIFLA